MEKDSFVAEYSRVYVYTCIKIYSLYYTLYINVWAVYAILKGKIQSTEIYELLCAYYTYVHASIRVCFPHFYHQRVFTCVTFERANCFSRKTLNSWVCTSCFIYTYIFFFFLFWRELLWRLEGLYTYDLAMNISCCRIIFKHILSQNKSMLLYMESSITK